MQIAWNEWIFNYFSLVIYYCTGDLFLNRSGDRLWIRFRGCGSCRQFMASRFKGISQNSRHFKHDLICSVSIQSKTNIFQQCPSSYPSVLKSNRSPSLAHFSITNLQSKNNIPFILTLDSTMTSRIFIKVAPFVSAASCAPTVYDNNM